MSNRAKNPQRWNRQRIQALRCHLKLTQQELADRLGTQPGLIHLYHTRYIQGKCYGCPLSQPEPGNHVQIQTGSFTSAEPVITARGNHSGIIGT